MEDIQAQERRHLAQADRHIAEAKEHIARQKEIIAELERDGHETDTAVSILHAFEHSLQAFENHRKLIIDRLADPLGDRRG